LELPIVAETEHLSYFSGKVHPSGADCPFFMELFEILMSSGRKLSLPTPQAEDTQKQNNKIRLYNKVLQLLEKAGLGFTQQNMDNGINFIQCINNSLWYIDPFLDKMYDMSCHLPMLFEHFSGYNDPNRHDFHICSFLCIKLLLIL
jgi:hypothetical protein